MSAASKRRASSLAVPMVVLSVVLHGAAWASVARIRPAPVRERIALEVVERSRPKPPVPLPAAEPPKPKPVPRRAVALARPAPAPPPALASAPQTPPPADAPRPLPRVGISLGSTVAVSSFAVGVGNTAYGQAGERAADPASVRPYAGGAVPAARLSAQPRVVELPEIAYPADARRAGTEGKVALLLRVDARGAVAGVRVLAAPSPSLARAAEEGARRFRFTPGLLDGEPVETEIRFIYTFVLE